jgi:alginate O-acetyltransferase complex protein AlgI
MVFSSLIFLFAFLPAVIAIYYAAPTRRYRNLVLLVFSYIFYFWGSGIFLAALFLSTLSDYIIGLLICKSETKKARGGWLALSIFINLGLLAYFKYSNFFIGEVNGLISSFGLSPMGWTEIILPIGISFFTFQKITYVVDVHRKTRPALRSFIDFALYVAMFPQLIAGPIVRFHEISAQLEGRKESFEGFYQGVLRFSLGLVKKVLVANICAEVADAAFAIEPSLLDTRSAWIGIFAYTLQIYFDFSAYSDMAIGLGHMFGFTLPENFNRPYSAISITDFWRRWHITLSNFFRDYLYLPLGGNRISRARTYINLMIVFVLCGLWHGASWTFLVWGLFHGALLIIERAIGLRAVTASSYIAVRRIVTFVVIMIAWVFFRAESLGHAIGFLNSMFVPSAKGLDLDLTLALSNRNIIFMIIASVVIFLPRDFSFAALLSKEKGTLLSAVQVCAVIILLLYSAAFLASGSYNPFIYFQF